MVEHDIGVECAILETKELVCGRLAVFISNRRRSPDIKYGCVSMLPLCGDVSGVSNSDMVRPYEHMYGLCRRRSMVAISENQVLRRYVRRHVIIVWRTHDTIPS